VAGRVEDREWRMEMRRGLEVRSENGPENEARRWA
jgi:hypothetical protein